MQYFVLGKPTLTCNKSVHVRCLLRDAEQFIIINIRVYVLLNQNMKKIIKIHLTRSILLYFNL